MQNSMFVDLCDVYLTLQADLEGSVSLLSHMAEEGSPQDIENFEIFKTFKGTECPSGYIRTC